MWPGEKPSVVNVLELLVWRCWVFSGCTVWIWNLLLSCHRVILWSHMIFSPVSCDTLLALLLKKSNKRVWPRCNQLFLHAVNRSHLLYIFNLCCYVDKIMLAVNVGLSFFGGTRMWSLSVNAPDLFVLSQEVVLNQYTSGQYFSNNTARLVVSAPVVWIPS